MIVTATRAATVPIEIGRDEARERARRELSSPRYAEDSPSWIQQALEWIWERVGSLVELASGGTTGRIVLVVAASALVIGIAIIVRRARPDARARVAPDSTIFGARKLTAADYRTAADAAVEAGDWSAAVVERFRAVAAALEERGVVEPRVGRTADELAREARTSMPAIHADLQEATVVFDHVLYGGREAGPDDHRRVEQVDRSLHQPRRRLDRAMTATPTLEPPR